MITKLLKKFLVKKNESLELRHIDGEWPSPKSTILPEQVEWANLGLTKKERRIRFCGRWMLVFILFLISYITIYQFEMK